MCVEEGHRFIVYFTVFASRCCNYIIWLQNAFFSNDSHSKVAVYSAIEMNGNANRLLFFQVSKAYLSLSWLFIFTLSSGVAGLPTNMEPRWVWRHEEGPSSIQTYLVTWCCSLQQVSLKNHLIFGSWVFTYLVRLLLSLSYLILSFHHPFVSSVSGG